jgi:hypothetical protein
MTDDELDEAITKAYDHLLAMKLVKPLGGWRGDNYCENWNDLMPLVIQYRINLCYDMTNDRWIASKTNTDGIDCFWEDFNTSNTDPQRAYCECLLKALEAKK